MSFPIKICKNRGSFQFVKRLPEGNHPFPSPPFPVLINACPKTSDASDHHAVRLCGWQIENRITALERPSFYMAYHTPGPHPQKKRACRCTMIYTSSIYYTYTYICMIYDRYSVCVYNIQTKLLRALTLNASNLWIHHCLYKQLKVEQLSTSRDVCPRLQSSGVEVWQCGSLVAKF